MALYLVVVSSVIVHLAIQVNQYQMVHAPLVVTLQPFRTLAFVQLSSGTLVSLLMITGVTSARLEDILPSISTATVRHSPDLIWMLISENAQLMALSWFSQAQAAAGGRLRLDRKSIRSTRECLLH
jgi:hypothetical protein